MVFMTIHADTLIDRIRLKSQLTRWRVTAILIAVIAVVAMMEKDSQFAPIRGSYIARISIDGIITDDKDLSKLIKTVQDDNYAKAVIVWIDSPGGSAVGGQQLYYDLHSLAQKKPVVIVMRSLAASAGYMAALAGDRLIAREGTITGSIGVIMEGAEFTELAKKLGIQPIVIKTGEFKASPSPLEKLTPRQEAALQTSIDDFFKWFKDLVAERRKLPLPVVDKLADGRIYSGKQALDNHLIDQLGGESEALDWLEQARHIDSSLNVRDVKEKKKGSDGLFDEMAHGVFSALTGAPAQPLGGLWALWKPNAL